MSITHNCDNCENKKTIYIVILVLLVASLTIFFLYSDTMAEASAADGKMKDLSISETKKNKKDGNPKTAAKKPQQQKKKVRWLVATMFESGQDVDEATD